MSEFEFGRRKLGAIVLEQGVLSEEQVRWALEKQKETKKFLGEILIEAGLLSEEELLKLLAIQFETEFLNLEQMRLARKILSILPLWYMRENSVIPVEYTVHQIKIAIADPYNKSILEDVNCFTRCGVKFSIATRSHINTILSQYAAIEKKGKENEDFSEIPMFLERRMKTPLVNGNIINYETAHELLEQSKATNRFFGDILTEKGLCSYSDLKLAWDQKKNTEYTDLSSFIPNRELISQLPRDILQKYHALPVSLKDNILKIAMDNDEPESLSIIDALQVSTGCKVEILLSLPRMIRKHLSGFIHIEEEKAKPVIKPVASTPRESKAMEPVRPAKIAKTEEIMEDIIEEVVDSVIEYEDYSTSSDLIFSEEHFEILHNQKVQNIFSETDKKLVAAVAQENQIVDFLNKIVATALKKNASDVHIEPDEETFSIRMRVDGSLYTLDSYSKKLLPALISRIKVLADLDIAEKHLAQDGSFKVSFQNNPVDFRVAVVPSVQGESAAVRILLQQKNTQDISRIGFLQEQLLQIQKNLERSFGLIVVNGPTGSGKTTTLYSMLHYLNTGSRKIITIEDPVEYKIPGIQQLQVHINKKESERSFGFKEGLRSMLRCDPNAIMIGEIRDSEVASIAMQASLTGHLVLSTIHANNSVDVLTRFMNLGVEKFLITSSLKLIVTQRLIRKLCPYCKTIDPDVSGLMNMLQSGDIEISFYKSTGCEKCNNSGYSGRTAVFETLPVTDEIRRVILSGGEILPSHTGTRVSLLDSCLRKAATGEISADDCLRVAIDSQ